jgi:hypothetical protein
LSAPELLRIPTHFRSVEDVLGAAAKMNLSNVLVLSEREDGALIFLDNGYDLAHTNWLLDRMKTMLLQPDTFSRVDR